MWAGGKDGMWVIDGQTMTALPDDHPLSSRRPHNLLRDHRGILWVGAWGEGVLRTDGRVVQTLRAPEGVTMSTLLRSGVTVLDSLGIVKSVMSNKLMEKVLEEVRTRILEGADIATPLKKSGVFPPVVGYMVAVGEQTGQLEEMLDRIAEAYEDEIETSTARALAVLEPVMIVLMAFIVGFIVVSVMMPILQSTSGLDRN